MGAGEAEAPAEAAEAAAEAAEATVPRRRASSSFSSSHFGAPAFKLHRWLSSAPAALAGLSKRKGAISEGFDADFVVWRPRELADVSVAGCRLRHCENSPFVGTGGDLELRGRVVATFLRGQLVFSSEEEEGEEKKKLGGARLSGCGGRLLERDA